MKYLKLKTTLVALSVGAVLAFSGAASASTIPVGLECGNKFTSLTQAGMTLTPLLCTDQDNSTKDGNSTGSKSPITPLGWISGFEVTKTPGSGDDAPSGQASGNLGLSVSGNSWTITNALGYPELGISVKQGNGFAFYLLDLTKDLSGMFYTGNNISPTGNDYSHINAWYKGTPTSPVPLPAAAWMLLAGLGGIAAMKRRKKA